FARLDVVVDRVHFLAQLLEALLELAGALADALAAAHRLELVGTQAQAFRPRGGYSQAVARQAGGQVGAGQLAAAGPDLDFEDTRDRRAVGKDGDRFDRGARREEPEKSENCRWNP